MLFIEQNKRIELDNFTININYDFKQEGIITGCDVFYECKNRTYL